MKGEIFPGGVTFFQDDKTTARGALQNLFHERKIEVDHKMTGSKYYWIFMKHFGEKQKIHFHAAMLRKDLGEALLDKWLKIHQETVQKFYDSISRIITVNIVAKGGVSP